MKWACCMLFCALLLTSSSFADARRSLPSTSQTRSLSGSEVRKWYPISRAIFGWSRVANRKWEAEERHPVDKLLRRSRVAEGEEEVGERHPADQLLRTEKADMTESYILGGY